MTPKERRELIDSLLEGDISEADFLRLEAELTVDADARSDYYDRLALSALLETEAASGAKNPLSFPRPRFRPLGWAAAAAALVGLAALAVHLTGPRSGSVAAEDSAPTETRASGFAVLAGQENAAWKGDTSLIEGALLSAGPLSLTSGVAQLELFSGVTVIVEGAADFELVSPLEMRLVRGKLRARVPPAASGFRISTREGDVVDLGTEFAIDLSEGRSELHVLDGEIEWHPRDGAARSLKAGHGLLRTKNQPEARLTADPTRFVGEAELRDRLRFARESRRERWRNYKEELRSDPRLVALYEMGDVNNRNRRLSNAASRRGVGEAAIVAAARAADRWGDPDGALDFSPTGSRVRLSVPGAYRSLTLLCWVKINSLDRWYNSLFLTDGHEQHEPHWQIMDDGRLFFSVKKNDVFDLSKGEKDKHVYFSPPFWNPSLGGRWLMIATVYDVDQRRVTHYLNGEVLSQEAAPSEYLVETVRIGNASIGNWGMPERDDPHFAVRNLNGSMSEFALFQAALSSDEIAEIYFYGKP